MMRTIEVYDYDYTGEFKKNIKRFVKKKRFTSLEKQISDLITEFENGYFSGKLLTHSDEPTLFDLYKLRLPNLDTNEGKSNGFRVIYLAATDIKLVVFLTVYYKKEQETTSDTFVEGLITGYFLNDLPEED